MLTQARRNLLSNPCRLPPEVLAHCFWFLQIVERPVPNSDSKPDIGWLKVLHVCGQWRQVAISNPSLWRQIDLRLGLDWASRMVLLSKATPISIEYNGGNRVMSLRSVLREHISRVDSLVLSSHHKNGIDLSDIAGPAPRLRRLEIRYNCYHSQSLSNTIFDNQIPCLQYLTLKNCTLPATVLPILTNLVSLSVTNDDEPLSPSPCITLLRHAGRLQSLSLRHCISRLGDDDLSPREGNMVTLPYLQRIRLDERLAGCAFLLQNLSFPPVNEFIISGTKHHYDTSSQRLSNHGNALLAAIAPNTSVCLSQVETLALTYHDVCGDPVVKMKAWDTFAEFVEDDVEMDSTSVYNIPRTSPVVSIDVVYPRKRQPSSALILNRLFSLTELRTLTVSGPSLHTASAWTEALAPAKQLRNLQTSGTRCAFSLFTALASSTSEGLSSKTLANVHSAPEHGIFLPSLVAVYFDDVDFHRIISKGSKEERQTFDTTLKDALKKRQQLGCPIRRLGINKCTVNPDSVEELIGLVSTVCFDGHVGLEALGSED